MAPSKARIDAATISTATPTRFDPKALLNPKAFKASKDVKAKEPANPYASVSGAGEGTSAGLLSPADSSHSFSKSSESDPPNAMDGQASFIERMHNVERREDRAVKRQKKSSEEGEESEPSAKKKSKSDHAGGGGDMGEYLKEKRREALEKQGPPQISDVVDLTADDGEELLVTSDTFTQEVCLGRIDGARVNAHKIPHPKKGGAFANLTTHWPVMKCTLQRRPGPTNTIAVADPQGQDFGKLDARIAAALVPLLDGKHVTQLRIQSRLDSRVKKPYEYPGQGVSDAFAISLNLYAPRKYVRGIGKFLSQKQVWLRTPLGVEHGVSIVNPHMPESHTPAQKTVLAKSAKVAGTIIVRTLEEARKDVFDIFDSLQDSKSLPGASTPPEVSTPLLFHQQQALYFMRKRELLPVEEPEGAYELGSIWKENIRNDGRKTWLNVITGHEVRRQPEPTRGGILADVMGLGKTLNVLSLVVSSLDEARAWATQEPSAEEVADNPVLEMNTKATLLICPLSTIVNWEEQINRHLKPRSLSYRIFQGSNRTNNAADLRSFDLVITTYPTVAAEINANKKSRNRPNSPLFELNWFRVVLDEAHTIRQQTTIQSRAACTLSASRRWCVSGTPVQNRLDDLGALIRFLRVKPFDEAGNFSAFISTPLRTGDDAAIPKLRVLVDSITLRRLKDKIDLPKRTEQIVKLIMNDEERKLYDFFAAETYQSIAAMTNNKKSLGGKSYAHVLKAILRLRLLSVHGSDMLSSDDWDKIKGWDPSNAIDLEDEDDERPERSAAQIFEMYRMMKDALVNSCARCETIVAPEESSNEDSGSSDDANDIFGYLTPCNHLICTSCIDEFCADMKRKAGLDNYGECGICETYIRVTFSPMKQSELAKDDKVQEELRNSRFHKNLTRYNGPSTKVQALLDDLTENERQSSEHPEDVPFKSVIFSEWVTLLDLIQLAISARGMKFSRLDGKSSFAQRQNAIKSFMDSSDVNIILVSLKAGGLGLNLTAANRVYTMEPNYNPAAEAQAVERVHRLGQTREVVIKRYIMENSIEEKVLKLQERKLALADFSVEREKSKSMMSRADVARQKLEELKSLLR